MKKLQSCGLLMPVLSLLAILSAAAAGPPVQLATGSKDQAEIRKLHTVDLPAAWSRGDARAASEIWDPDGEVEIEGRIAKGRAEIEHLLHRGWRTTLRSSRLDLTVQEIKTSQKGSATVHGAWEISGTRADGRRFDRSGLYESVLVKRSGKWRIQSWRPDEVQRDQPAVAKAAPAAPAIGGAQSFVESYAQLPLSFEPNQGQADPQVKFLSQGSGYALLLTSTEATLILRQSTKTSPLDISSLAIPSIAQPAAKTSVLRLQLYGANPAPDVSGIGAQESHSNYFIGNNPTGWRTKIPNFSKAQMQQVYPGIDLIFYGNQRQLEYDFAVAPGADPSRIRLSASGSRRPRIDASGDVVLNTDAGDIRLLKPRVYQQMDEDRRTIPAEYAVNDDGQVVFVIGSYDRSRTLVIDPVLSYAMVFGGLGTTEGFGLVVDASGNAYVTGATCATDFPVTPHALRRKKNGTSGSGCEDAFVMKINKTATSLVYSTYLGGSDRDSGTRLAVDSTGAVYVTGITLSGDFPTTSGAFDTSLQGSSDAFVSKLNPGGDRLVYSTFLGGDSNDFGVGIAVDTPGSAYVTGFTTSTNFPTSPSPIQGSLGGGTCFSGTGPCPDAFVTKLSPDGKTLDYSTYLGGNSNDFGMGISVDSVGNAYVAGGTDSPNFPTTTGAFQTTGAAGNRRDAFVAKINATGSALVYSTFLGGTSVDVAAGIAIDSSGAAYIAGGTLSTDFPATAGSFQTVFGGTTSTQCQPLCGDAFIAKLNAAGSKLDFATYVGGSGDDSALDIALDSSQRIWITGQSGSPNFPTSADAYVSRHGFLVGTFLFNLSADGKSMLFSTFVGPGGLQSMGTGVTLDAANNVYVTGLSDDFPSFPTTPGVYGPPFNTTPEGFLAKFSPGSQPAVTLSTSFLSFDGLSLGGSSPPQSLNLTNTGTGPLSLALGFNDGFSGNAAADFSETDNCASTLAPSASCTINVVFTPSASGSRSSFLVVTSNAPGTHTLSLQGWSGLGPSVGLSPATLNFGGQGVGTTSPQLAAQLLNLGDVPLLISSTTITGANSPDFVVTSNNCGKELFEGFSCMLLLEFKPSASGSRTAALTFVDNAPGSPHSLALSGTAVTTAAVSVSPSPLDFGTQPVGISQLQGVTVTNIGKKNLGVTQATATGDFTALSFCSTVSPGASCSINVTFLPSQAGQRTGTLSITDNGFGSPQKVSLTGLGLNSTGPALQIVGTLTDFGQIVVGRTTAPQLLPLRNAGNANLTITSITASGNFATTNNCPTPVAPSGGCTVKVTFTPKATGVRTGALVITSDAPGSPNKFALSGTGTLVPGVSLSPGKLAFGDQDVGKVSGSLPVLVTNTGQATLAISSIVVSAGFAQSGTCGSSLAPGANCTMNVAFTPVTSGPQSGTIALSDNADGLLQSVALSGRGVTRAGAVLSPRSLSFADQLVGTTSATQTVTLTSSGRGTLLLSGIIARGDFTETNTCGSTLAEGATCIISVAFKPTTGGQRSGSLVVGDSGPGSPQVVPLTGTGVLVTLTPGNLDFGSVPVGNTSSGMSVLVTNHKTTALSIASALTSGDFGITSNNCGNSLPAGGSCSIEITFTPKVVGARNGELKFTYMGTGSPQIVGLSGTGM